MSTNLSDLSLRDHLTDAGLDKWFPVLSIPAAPVRRAGLRETLEFLDQHLPSMKPTDAVSLILAMDLSKRVSSVLIRTGEHLIAARAETEAVLGPRKLFFTRPGRSMQRSGISDTRRRFVSFTARVDFIALESFTAPTIDTWTQQTPGTKTTVAPRATSLGVLVNGGNVQLLIPNSQACLSIDRFGKEK